MFNFSKYCGAFHCCTTLASIVGTLTVTIHQKLKSHVITLSPQLVTTSLNSQPLEHRKKHQKEREKEKRHQQPPQTSAELKNTGHATQQLELTQSYRACKYNTALHGTRTHTHTHAAWSVVQTGLAPPDPPRLDSSQSQRPRAIRAS